MKRRIAFVDRCMGKLDNPDSLMDRTRAEENEKIRERLGKFYNLSAYHMLDGVAYKRLEQNSVLRQYEAIITHVPYDETFIVWERTMAKRMRKVDLDKLMPEEKRDDAAYRPSLDLLKRIHKKFPKTVIIAYTGAGEKMLPDEKLHAHGVSHVLRRKGTLEEYDLEADVNQIIEWIG